MARAFAHLYLEVERGARPHRQLQRLLCPVLYARLPEVWVRPHAPPPQLRTVTGCRTAPGSFEAVATVTRGHRVGALAFRLRRTSAGWRVDELCRPEHGPLPDPPFPVPVDEPDVFDLVP
ncbi:hypothetical protein ER308_06315 [Egibacter rhizosphaerae]|uniref:Uncharacterized protein n=1 Tax=Egibacter rhizosphaerae TaxID=1670831 RepID=A0A411YDB5_9ACTN|nr:Rv3235 family protein [Egibacter rhizosphaerae]QBI19190.1 hypothetical protein ER308_06315 [Egibacter rhizosphaerae]